MDCVAEAELLVKHYPESQFSSRDAARALGRTTEWVLSRRNLLKLPPDKQELFRTGKIPLKRIRAVLTSPDPDALCAALMNRSHVRQPMPAVKTRTAAEVRRLMNQLEVCEIGGLPMKVLAWQTGALSDDDIQFAIDRFIETGE